jgi:hypothetical protein
MLSLNINLLSVHCTQGTQSTQRYALHIRFQAIYLRAVAARDEGHVACAKSRVVGSLGMPIFFLAFLGLRLEHASMPRLPAGVDYVAFPTFIREHIGGTVDFMGAVPPNAFIVS